MGADLPGLPEVGDARADHLVLDRGRSLAVAVHVFLTRTPCRAAASMPSAATRSRRAIAASISRGAVLVYVLSGAIAGLCGYLWVARYGVAYSEIALGYELTVIAACVIGGISIGGGIGTVRGGAARRAVPRHRGQRAAVDAGLAVLADGDVGRSDPRCGGASTRAPSGAPRQADPARGPPGREGRRGVNARTQPRQTLRSLRRAAAPMARRAAALGSDPGGAAGRGLRRQHDRLALVPRRLQPRRRHLQFLGEGDHRAGDGAADPGARDRPVGGGDRRAGVARRSATPRRRGSDAPGLLRSALASGCCAACSTASW